MIQSLVINFAGVPLPEDPYWLTIVPPVYDDRATVADVAAIVDSLYDIDPCVETTGAPPTEPKPEDLPRAAQAIDLDLCKVLMSGDYEAEIKVIRSHPDLPYKFIASLGEVTQTVKVEEKVTVTIDVQDATSVTLELPVVSGLAASWLGSVHGVDGAVSAPRLDARHNTLFWLGSVTGTIRAAFVTTYDLVTLAVPGLKAFPEDPSGDPQGSDILAFYHYQSYTATIEPPPEDPAADEAFLAAVCGWLSGGGAGITEDEPLPEDPPPPEDPCFDPAGDLHDPEFYKYKCCHYPPWPLPDCQGWIAGHKPGKGLDQEVMDAIIAGHRGPVEFVGIGNPGPEGCGEIIHRIEVHPKNCCDEVVPLEADPTNPTTISSGGRARLYVLFGGPVLTWQATGGLYFDNGSSVIVTPARYVFVNAPQEFCARAVIEVTDDCSELSMVLVKPDAVPLHFLTCVPPPVMAPLSYLAFPVDGGTPPYTGWSSDKLIHMGGGIFMAPEDFCGAATVSVMDACMEQAECVVRSTVGHWEDTVPPHACVGLTGPRDLNGYVYVGAYQFHPVDNALGTFGGNCGGLPPTAMPCRITDPHPGIEFCELQGGSGAEVCFDEAAHCCKRFYPELGHSCENPTQHLFFWESVGSSYIWSC